MEDEKPHVDRDHVENRGTAAMVSLECNHTSDTDNM